MKKIVELYRNILPAIGLTADQNDQIFVGGAELGNVHPLEIDGKGVYLPTEAFLKNSALREQIAFHPLAEDTLKKRSQVLTAIQNAYSWRLYTAGVMLIDALLTACIKQKNGEEISNPRLLSYISGNEACDEKVRLFFKKLSETISADPSKKLFSVYLRHGNEANDGSSRQCVISSPLVQELERIAAMGSSRTGGLTVWGVESPRKKDVELLANLIKTIFPGIENKSYTVGSNDKIAPYCDALFMSLREINQNIVDAAMALAKVEPVSSVIEYLCIDLTPVDVMLDSRDDYDIFRNSIIKTAYNDGDGWNTAIRNPSDSERPKTELPTQRGRQNNDEAKVEDPVAITKDVIINAIKAIPGTRQPLISGITEDDYRTVKPPRSRRDTGRNADYRGNHEDGRRPSSKNRRPVIDDFRNSREAAEMIQDLKQEKRDLERDRDLTGAREIELDIRDLYDILDDLERAERGGRGSRDRDRDDRGRDRDDRDRGRSSRYGSDDRPRPRPRAVESNDRSRRGRDDNDRFGRRR